MGNIDPQMEQYADPTAGIEANDLLIFARVADLGSFSRAAERLGLPKSTVSRRVAWLESHLGERLLLRTTRRQTLTEFGSLLLEHARQVAAEVEAVTALREHRQAAPSGRLRVSMPSDFATLLLADTLAAFVTLHPRITLELDLSPRRVDLLGEGFDVAVRMGALPDDALLAARRLTVFTNGLYASPHYLAEHGEPTCPEGLLQHDTVRLPGRAGDTTEPGQWLLTRGEERWEGSPPSRVMANQPELLLILARASAGITAVPDLFAQPWLQRGELRRVLPEWCLPSHTAWAVFPGRKLMPAKTRVFIDMLEAALQAP
jgi:DNA-binding transcriptional LysR family regulator